jgi:hypothetical protein
MYPVTRGLSNTEIAEELIVEQSTPRLASSRPAESARSRRCVVMEVHHAAGEPAHVEQFEVQTDVAREERLAAPHDDGRHEHVQLVDQPGRDGLGCEVGTADGDVT